MRNGDVTDVESKRCRHTDLKVRKVSTALITAGYTALNEVARPKISVVMLNGPYDGTQSRKKANVNRTIMTEILCGAKG